MLYIIYGNEGYKKTYLSTEKKFEIYINYGALFLFFLFKLPVYTDVNFSIFWFYA